MAFVGPWTGRTACALQAALRLSNELFARRLGVVARTVSKWHEKPDMTPRTEMQQALDTVYEQLSEAERARFASLITEHSVAPPAPGAGARAGGLAQALTVAVAIVVSDAQVLIVQRRGEDGGGISWQFPAGVVKPGVSPDTVAVRETLAETGVHCSVTRDLGGRLHPITNVRCDYLLCDYLAGDVENKDLVENVSVTWAATEQLPRFIPAGRIFPPILEALEVHSD